MTQEAILEQLKSSKFSDFANGIENTKTYFKETGYDELLFKNALSVYTYHLDHKHEEIETAYQKIDKNFEPFFNVLKDHEKFSSNWFSSAQIKGLSTFLTNYKEGKLDLSGYFMVSGFTYQIAAQTCESVLEVADRNEFPEECEALELFYSVFDELWKIQMTTQGTIRETKTWNDDSYDAVGIFNNVLNRADLQDQMRMLAGLSAHEKNPYVHYDIVIKYSKSLEIKIDKLETEIKQLTLVQEKVTEWFPA